MSRSKNYFFLVDFTWNDPIEESKKKSGIPRKWWKLSCLYTEFCEESVFLVMNFVRCLKTDYFPFRHIPAAQWLVEINQFNQTSFGKMKQQRLLERNTELTRLLHMTSMRFRRSLSWWVFANGWATLCVAQQRNGILVGQRKPLNI